MKFADSPFFLFWSEIGFFLFLADKEIFSFLNKIFIEIVVFGHFGNGGDVSGKEFVLFPHVTNDVSDLVDNIAISDDSDDLNSDNDKDLGDVWRGDIAIADSQHGGKGEV